MRTNLYEKIDAINRETERLVGVAIEKRDKRIEELERENEALRNDLALSNDAWEKSQARIAELEAAYPELIRENEALRKHVSRLEREIENEWAGG